MDSAIGSGNPEALSLEDIEDRIEAAEETLDIIKLLTIIKTCNENGSQEDWDVPAEASLDAFYRVVKGGDADLILPKSTRATFFWSLKVWKEEEAIVEVALGCIAAIGAKGEECLEETVIAIDGNLIVDIMKQYQDEAAIQEQACLAIKGLAERDEMKQRLRAVEGIAAELKAAEGRITNERNKKYAGQAAAALGLQL
mmetsp:Transcript_26486/g.56896  ORF Transcript_26486/g.56896 Transcript_26486/m.56896 type:complete len:198 (-) Transcript_26486:168-761(-)|eukprot:CAMPEP_0172304100 /NCGR_PEP_ID=MMETSP1058-20130122/5546_1 /TAXON_ID=83371 /ORGANISM="Detonula confervacea, Strain CCMP 353" /LENGTH=197 /DNA_ID=CAMNT_0013015185 /DNA_START=256 /DNA_END=849 /DNA_ORIENTATION=+